MAFLPSYCPNCMKEIPGSDEVCPFCGSLTKDINGKEYLTSGLIIAGKYLVGKMIKRNLDCAVYLGRNIALNRVVEIREFFPKEIAKRNSNGSDITPYYAYTALYNEYRAQYIALWKNLMHFKGLPALFDVNDVLSLNSTCYAVTEHSKAVTYKKVLENTDLPLNENDGCKKILSFLSTLESLHTAGIVHGGIAPESLIETENGKLTLSGFVVPSMRRNDGGEGKYELYDGFAAPEQYVPGGDMTPAADIYSVGAMIFYLLTGRILPRSDKRNYGEEIFTPEEKSSLNKAIIYITEKCLQQRPLDRPSNVREVTDILEHGTDMSGSFNNRTLYSTVTYLGGRDNRIIKIAKNESYTKPEQSEAPAVTTAVKPKPVPEAEKQKPEAKEEIKEEEKKKPQTPETRIPETPVIKKPKTAVKERPAAKQQKVRKQKEEKRNPVVIAAIVSFAVAAVLFAATVLLYGTVLFKYFDAPVFDNWLSGFDSLPINQYVEVQETKYITVPDFSTLTMKYIQNDKNYNKHFSFQFETEYSDTIEKGYIVSQSPAAGENVPQGSTITITVSLGIKYITMIDVTGMNYEEAKARLEEIGFTVEGKETFNIGIHRTGDVAEQNLPAGQVYRDKTEVRLVYWAAPLASPTEQNTTTTGENTTDSNESGRRGGIFNFFRYFFGG